MFTRQCLQLRSWVPANVRAPLIRRRNYQVCWKSTSSGSSSWKTDTEPEEKHRSCDAVRLIGEPISSNKMAMTPSLLTTDCHNSSSNKISMGERQQQQEERIRAIAMSVVHKLLTQQAFTNNSLIQQQSRSFSSSSDKDTKVEGTKEDSKSSKDKESTSSKNNNNVTFEKIVQVALPPGATKVVEEQVSEEYEETYRYIRRSQRYSVEKARARTFINVRRALIGNMVICVAKLGAWTASGSSSMWSEFVHSVVDCGNQSLLLVGLQNSTNAADRAHPYGYGKSIYFWALVSALGTFFLGAGVSGTHAVHELMNPSLNAITWHVWAVLFSSIAIDGYVFGKTIQEELVESKPKNKTMWQHFSNLRDPATLAILLEDGAACLGVVLAIAGIAATHYTTNPIYDGVAGVGISALLACMGLILVRVNHSFLLGQGVDREITEGIEKILRSRRSIDNVQSVQSQWTSSETFSYKAEVDFDGTYLAAKLMPRYQKEFMEIQDSFQQDSRVLLSWYAEDVIRTVEREVRSIETEIRRQYPGAEYIELEPMSKDVDRFAIDDGMETQLRRVELEALNRYLKSLYLPKDGSSSKGESQSGTPADESKPTSTTEPSDTTTFTK